MITIFGWLLSPIGRWIAIVCAAAFVLGGLYLKILLDGEQRALATVSADTAKRVENAVRAGDAVIPGPNGMRNDKWCRNC